MTEDAAAIRRVLAGETEAFRQLVERYERPVFGLLAHLVADPREREDLAQEAFLAAFRRLDTYDARRAAFSTWLLTIARNLCLNHLGKKRPLLVEQLPEAADERDPQRSYLAIEACRMLDTALGALPFEQRTAFVLAEFEGMAYDEIGRIEGVGLGTVKSRIGRARRRLRAVISGEKGASRAKR